MPKGFLSFGINIGIKDDTKDFGVIYSEIPCKATAVFTKNNFPGAPVIVGKEHVRSG
ncbi:bifunctional ornithine acetyltransferase/N-acetylglutamate synthase, partial [Leptospira interrogans]